jgi:hypothetical protein
MIKKSQKDTKIEVSRRSFMKRTVYTTPKIIALGLLAQTNPSSAALPDGPPDGPANSGQAW